MNSTQLRINLANSIDKHKYLINDFEIIKTKANLPKNFNGRLTSFFSEDRDFLKTFHQELNKKEIWNEINDETIHVISVGGTLSSFLWNIKHEYHNIVLGLQYNTKWFDQWKDGRDFHQLMSNSYKCQSNSILQDKELMENWWLWTKEIQKKRRDQECYYNKSNSEFENEHNWLISLLYEVTPSSEQIFEAEKEIKSLMNKYQTLPSMMVKEALSLCGAREKMGTGENYWSNKLLNRLTNPKKDLFHEVNFLNDEMAYIIKFFKIKMENLETLQNINNEQIPNHSLIKMYHEHYEIFKKPEIALAELIKKQIDLFLCQKQEQFILSEIKNNQEDLYNNGWNELYSSIKNFIEEPRFI